MAAAAPAWPECPGLPRPASVLPLTRLSPYPFLLRPIPLPAPRRRRAGAAVFPSRRPGLSLSPGPAGDVSHTCAEDAPVTGEEAAAGGGAGGGEGAPTSSCSPAPWPGTVPAPSHPPPARPPSLSSLYPPAGARPRPAPPVCSALPAPLQQPPPTSPGARLVSEMPLQQQVSDPYRAGAAAGAPDCVGGWSRGGRRLSGVLEWERGVGCLREMSKQEKSN